MNLIFIFLKKMSDSKVFQLSFGEYDDYKITLIPSFNYIDTNEISLLINTPEMESYSAKIDESKITTQGGKPINLIKLFNDKKQKKKEIKIELISSEKILKLKIETKKEKEDELYKLNGESNFVTIDNLKEEEGYKCIIEFKIIKNEYYVFYRDHNFGKAGGFGKSLERIKRYCIEKENIFLYFEKSIENALKFIKKRHNDKIILLSNIGEDLSGKRFVEIVRKMCNCNYYVFFYSFNQHDFIQTFPNCLWAKDKIFTEKYINYAKSNNKAGIRELKKQLEAKYNIQLNGFSEDLSSSEINPQSSDSFIRHVILKTGKKFLCMLKVGEKYQITTKENYDKDNKDDCEWDITILERKEEKNNKIVNEKTITFSCKDHYLSYEYGLIESSEYMKEWIMEEKDGKYYFRSCDERKILSISGDGKLKLKKTEPKEGYLFEINDIFDEREKIISESICSTSQTLDSSSNENSLSFENDFSFLWELIHLISENNSDIII